MPLASEVKAGTRQTVIVMGKSGVGKTTTLPTFPKPVFIADFDGHGMDCIAGAEDVWYECYADKFPASEYADFAWYQFRLAMLEITEERLTMPDGRPFATICVDSMTHAVPSAERFTLFKVHRERGKPGELVHDIPQGYDDWNRITEQVKSGINQMKLLDGVVVFTCHLKSVMDEFDARREIMPNLFGGKLPQWIPSACSDVYYMRIMKDANGNARRVWQVHPDDQVECKTCLKGCEMFEAPDFSAMLRKDAEWRMKNSVTMTKSE